MSLKNSYVTSDYIEWDTMLSLVRKLYRDKEYRLSLLIGCGSYAYRIFLLLHGLCCWMMKGSLL